jgi:hypothetical protein
MLCTGLSDPQLVLFVTSFFFLAAFMVLMCCLAEQSELPILISAFASAIPLFASGLSLVEFL